MIWQDSCKPEAGHNFGTSPRIWQDVLIGIFWENLILLAFYSLDIHPTKDLLATGSDDHSWKIWSVPNGELLMTGEGHEDWLSSVHFHPGLAKVLQPDRAVTSFFRGSLLASTSGDGSVKLWNLAEAAASLTLSDHCQPG